jgi:hypothetical protein
MNILQKIIVLIKNLLHKIKYLCVLRNLAGLQRCDSRRILYSGLRHYIFCSLFEVAIYTRIIVSKH